MSLDASLSDLLADVLDPIGDPFPTRIGVDCEDIASVERADRVGGSRRLDRLFTSKEQADIAGSINRQAARHAAKEAVAKSLGTGFRDGLAARHIEILTDRSGAPSVVLHGPAADVAQTSGVGHVAVSWTRCGGFVLAAAVSFARLAQVAPFTVSSNPKEAP